MDIATVLGVVIATGLILSSIILGGGTFGAFMDPPSVMVVLGGSIAAAMISFPMKNFLSVFTILMKVFFYKLDAVPGLIEEIVSLAETARQGWQLLRSSRKLGLSYLRKISPEWEKPTESRR